MQNETNSIYVVAWTNGYNFKEGEKFDFSTEYGNDFIALCKKIINPYKIIVDIVERRDITRIGLPTVVPLERIRKVLIDFTKPTPLMVYV